MISSHSESSRTMLRYGSIDPLIVTTHEHFEEECVPLKNAVDDLFVRADLDWRYRAGCVCHGLVWSHSIYWISHRPFGYKDEFCNQFGRPRSIE